MLRFGKIIDLHPLTGLGEIMDEHEQDISFELKHSHEDLKVGFEVQFKIEMTENGLHAIEVKKLR